MDWVVVPAVASEDGGCAADPARLALLGTRPKAGKAAVGGWGKAS